MDIQYIWLGLTLGVLRGITNVGTVKNWLVFCLHPFLLSQSETTGVAQCVATHWNPLLFTHTLHLHVAATLCTYASAHSHLESFSHIQVETAPGPHTLTSWRAGTLIFFLSQGKSALWYEFRASWAAPLDIVREDQKRGARKNSERLLKASQKEYSSTHVDKCNFSSWILIPFARILLQQCNKSPTVDMTCVLASKMWKRSPVFDIFCLYLSCMDISELSYVFSMCVFVPRLYLAFQRWTAVDP